MRKLEDTVFRNLVAQKKDKNFYLHKFLEHLVLQIW